jgi:hypothetical protein
MGLDRQQRQERQASTEAAEEAAAHSNWTYPWPPAADDSLPPVHRGDDGDKDRPDDGGSADTIGTSNGQSRDSEFDRQAGGVSPPLSLWTYVAVSAAVAGCVTLLWKWRH